MTQLLIDADVDAFAACIGAETEVNWGDDIYSISSDLSEAKRSFIRRIRSYRELLESDDYLLCFSSTDNFRKELNPEYKLDRSEKRKPLGYRDIIEWAKGEFPSYSIPRLEADDVMGILATRDPTATVITVDKDLKTVPCRLYRYSPQKPREAKVEINTKEMADQFFLMQCITGDETDHFFGIDTKGWGPVTIQKWLDKSGGLSWSNVVRLYESLGKTYEDALLTARQARILTDDLYNEETGKITLWTPEYAGFTVTK